MFSSTRKHLRHPIRSIREPFGKAGLILACLALIAALGGTAWAAAKLNSTQKKEVEKIAKKYAGKPGAPGAPGTAGTNGTNGKDGAPGAKGENGTAGTNGTNGTDGTNGKSVVLTAEPEGANCEKGGTKVEVEGNAASKKYVCNGKNGTTGFTETLPSGKTETGTVAYAIYGNNGNESSVAISFPIPLAAAGPSQAVFLTETETETVPGSGKEGCTGTREKPTAPSGKLCIYAANEGGSFSGARYWDDAEEGNEAGYGPTGTSLFFTIAGGGADLRATWAVTAP